VQLLEAASVLVAMNNVAKDNTTPPDSAKDFPSDPESASPAASGYSEQHDRQSSADTTPPPHLEGFNVSGPSSQSFAKRYSSGSGFSRSYQSAPSSNFPFAGSAPNGFGFGHFRQPSDGHRPQSSGRNATGQDDRDLATAIELLSCSFGSNNGRTVTLPADAPPVPPVPAQYLDQAASLTSTGFINSFPRRQPESFTRGTQGKIPNEDVKMVGSGESVTDEEDDDDMHSRTRSDEDDDGVFGRMEE
jgi:hypothetical protein